MSIIKYQQATISKSKRLFCPRFKLMNHKPESNKDRIFINTKPLDTRDKNKCHKTILKHRVKQIYPNCTQPLSALTSYRSSFHPNKNKKTTRKMSQHFTSVVAKG